MMFPCLAAAFCLEGDLEALQKSGNDCHDIAVKTQDLSTTARSKAELAVSNTNEIKELLASFGTKIDLSTFQKIQELVQQKKARETIAIAQEMDDMAIQLAGQAGEMMASLQKGIDSLPETIRDELQEEDENQQQGQAATTTTGTRGGVGGDTENYDDDDDAAALSALLDVDTDISEMAGNTRGIERTNIFTAAQTGRDFYERVADKENTCRDIFDKIRSVGTSIARMAQAFAVATGSGTGSCCAQLKAIGAGAMELFKCLRLAKLVQKAAAAVGRLLQAIGEFLKSSWNTFQNFLSEFDAAKRMGRLFQNINPVKIINNHANNNPIIADAAAMGQSLLENVSPMKGNFFGKKLFGKRSNSSKHRQIGSY